MSLYYISDPEGGWGFAEATTTDEAEKLWYAALDESPEGAYRNPQKPDIEVVGPRIVREFARLKPASVDGGSMFLGNAPYSLHEALMRRRREILDHYRHPRLTFSENVPLVPPVDMLPCGWASPMRVTTVGALVPDVAAEALKYV